MMRGIGTGGELPGMPETLRRGFVMGQHSRRCSLQPAAARSAEMVWPPMVSLFDE